MVHYYDPGDEPTLARVEQILKSNGIEYCLRQEAGMETLAAQVFVAEEDISKADELLR
jgi:hypothetical protein